MTVKSPFDADQDPGYGKSMKTLDHNLNDAIPGFDSLETYTQALGQVLQSCRFPFDWLIHDPFPTNSKTPAHSEMLSETLTAMAFILTQTKDFSISCDFLQNLPDWNREEYETFRAAIFETGEPDCLAAVRNWICSQLQTPFRLTRRR